VKGNPVKGKKKGKDEEEEEEGRLGKGKGDGKSKGKGGRPPLSCTSCKKEGLASDFSCEDHNDWQGGLFLLCELCWCARGDGRTAAQFRTESNRSWTKRSMNARQATRVRNFQDVVSRTEKLDTESSRAYPRRLTHSAAALAGRLIQQFMKAPPQHQEQICQALDEYYTDMGKIADDPSFVPLLHGKLDDNVDQYLSSIMKHVDEYYVCRDPDCGYFSISASWIGNDPTGLCVLKATCL
jgi:hypothetical protein